MAEVVNLITLEVGVKVFTTAGATIEIIENPKDGVWIFGKYTINPNDPSLVGTEEMFFAQDISEVLN